MKPLGDCLIVLGMHRSGTSAMSGVLKLLGVDLGDRLLPGSERDNELGMFENIEVFEFHERLLAANARTWSDLTPLASDWLAQSDTEGPRNELAAILRSLFDGSPVWGVKDPRMCGLLPLWLSVLDEIGATPRLILMHRHPQEVAASLAHRNHFSGEKSTWLWSDHHLRAERATRRRRRVFVSFDELFRDPLTTVESIGKRLGLEWPRSGEVAAEEIRAFVSPTMRHHQVRRGRKLIDLGRFEKVARRLHKALEGQRLTAGRGSAKTFDSIAALQTEATDAIDPLFLELIREHSRITTRERDAIQRQLDERTEWLRIQDQDANRIREALMASLGDLVSVKDQLDEKVRVVGGLQEELKQQAEELAAQRTVSAEHAEASLESKRVLDKLAGEQARGSLESKEALDKLAGDAKKHRDLVARLQTEVGRVRETLEGQSRLQEELRVSSEKLASEFSAGETRLEGLRQQDSERIENLENRLELELDVWKGRVRRLAEAAEVQSDLLVRVEALLDERTNWLKIQAKDPDSVRAVVLQLRKDVVRLEQPGPVRRSLQQALRAIRSPGLALRFLWDKLASSSSGQVVGGGVPPPVEISTEDALSDARLQETVFETEDEPLVSIVIPVHNYAAVTMNCLESIAEHGAAVSFEVILLDDCSTEPEVERLGGIEGLRFLRNDSNLGFVGTCNRGGAEARGEFLLLLNNDTLVTSGWLDALVETFDTFADAGIVGGKLLFPDGTVQEAGGLVWRDGSAWNFGRHADVDEPTINYARRVDYCSGSCLMIRRDLYNDLGGFDDFFAPGYYEDTDLAFRVRERGLSVIYQPTARVIHYECVSSGSDPTTGFKRHQEINAKRFYGRWKDSLRRHRPNGEKPELEKERGVEKRVLIVDHRTVTPDMDSGSVRMRNLMQVFQDRGYKVSFVPDNLAKLEPYAGQLQARGVEVLYHPFVSSVEEVLAERGSEFDLVILSRVAVASKHIVDARRYCPEALIVFDTVDLHFLRLMREAELSRDSRDRAEAERTREKELEVASLADSTLVVSPYEADKFAELAPHVDVHVVSNIHETRPTTTPFEERRDIFFIGGFEHPPNVDGVRWFVTEIFPRIRGKISDIRFHIIGSKMPPEIQRLDSDATPVAGFVPDVRPFFEGCRLSVAPLRYGAGVKGKVNHSMAQGVPCVATTIACEGMFLTHGVDVLVADEPEPFAEMVFKLYRGRDLWQRLAAEGLKNIEDNFSFAAAARAIDGICKRVEHRSSPATREKRALYTD